MIRAHERRPDADRRSSAYHPQGVRLNGHLLRGGAATRTVDHCTSPPFVPGNRTRWARSERKARRCEVAPDGSGGREADRADRRRAERLERLVEDRVVAGRRSARQRRRRRPASARRRGSSACRGQPAGDRQPEPAAVAVSSVHCWTVPLPNDCLADERRPLRVLQRAGDDLARRRGAAVDEARRAERRVRRDAAGQGLGRRSGCPSASCSQKMTPEPMNWLATVAGGGHEPARVAAQVEDQLGPAGLRRGRRAPRAAGRAAASEKPVSRM